MAPTPVVPPWARRASLGLSLLAVGLAGYLILTHYTDPTALACPDRGVVNCTLVTTSSWSSIVGVPVALLGLLWAVAMTALTTPWAWRSRARWPDLARVGGAAAGVAMVLYLVYIELFAVDAVCLWCTGVHLTALALFTVLWVTRTPRSGQGVRARG